MRMGGQRHNPGRSTPGKKTRYSSYRKLGDPRAGLNGCGKSPPLRDSTPGTSSLLRVTIPTTRAHSPSNVTNILHLVQLRHTTTDMFKTAGLSSGTWFHITAFYSFLYCIRFLALTLCCLWLYRKIEHQQRPNEVPDDQQNVFKHNGRNITKITILPTYSTIQRYVSDTTHKWTNPKSNSKVVILVTKISSYL